ncbi:MAG TPA: GNAT family N-acetyltransferase [Solirubrobacteraceae bacterium]|nr:GNAT family N-acetyltransferase [Solirubrobacteraceae bacterium]
MSTTLAPPRPDTGVHLRPIASADVDAVAAILFKAFAGIHDRHRFPRDFPTLEAALELTTAFAAHPQIHGVVAEAGGRVVGSNFLDERGPVRGVGPITVDPDAQARGVGRRLMQAVIDRAAGARGVRLLQDSFNVQSLALYSSLGFEVVEPVVVMAGTPRVAPAGGVEVRPLQASDLDAAERLHVAVHGYERTNELRDALGAPHLDPFVAIRDGRLVAYATTLSFFPAAYGVAERDEDIAALVAGASAATGKEASFLLPTRQTALFRWALDAGLRVVKPMTYMTIGERRDAAGAWIPSVLY